MVADSNALTSLRTSNMDVLLYGIVLEYPSASLRETWMHCYRMLRSTGGPYYASEGYEIVVVRFHEIDEFSRTAVQLQSQG